MGAGVRSSQALMSSRGSAPSRGALASLGLIVAVLATAFAAWRWLESVGGADTLLVRFGALAPLVSVPLHIVLSASPFPSEIVGVANGALYGIWLGTLCGWIGWCGGAMLEFSLVRLGVRYIEPNYDLGRLPLWLRRFPVGHPVFLIVGRQIPFGFHMVNVLAALADVSPTRQLICALVSNLLYAFVSAAIGTGLLALW